MLKQRVKAVGFLTRSDLITYARHNPTAAALQPDRVVQQGVLMNLT